ncbi:unnamed protein product [Ambrosiozyma monospora]|uniref:Unnamed protein product n=1 Tax=Ambrosiozyma monospora TaxID=43982 RepID=A0A9W6Z5S8_AMBMO|nr:unnamed protein product [Ambrosiozyma monospora]
MLREKKSLVSEFSCPLCGTYCNAFIPSVSIPDTFNVSMDGFLRASSWQEALRNQNTENCNDMSSLIFGKEFFHVLNDQNSPQNKKIFNQLSHLSHENLMLNKISPSMDIEIGTGNAISILIGNTLELLQIANRFEVETEDAKISGINLELLRSLVQFKVLLSYTNDNRRIVGMKEVYLSNNFGFIAGVVMLYLQGEEFLEIILKIFSSKWLLRAIFSIIARRQLNAANLSFESVYLKDVNDPPAEIEAILSQLIKRCAASGDQVFLYEVKEKDYDHETTINAYKILSSIYENYREQFNFLKQLLNIQDGEMETLDTLISWIKDTQSIEYSVFVQLEHRLYSYKAAPNALALDFPGKVHLDNLPVKLSELTSLKNISEDASTGTVICLLCGEVVTKRYQHVASCCMNQCGYAFYFSPFKNMLMIDVTEKAKDAFCKVQVRHMTFSIGSPYLNKHGEAAGGLIGSGDSGTLNPEEWLNLYKI